MIGLELKKYNMISTESSKISALSLGKVDKYEFLTGEEISSDQSRTIEQAKFTYSPLGKAFEKQKRLKSKEKNKLKPSKSMENS